VGKQHLEQRNSQRFADPYSFSHIVHGILFYAGLWLVARKLPVRHRLLIALAIEAGWEILENSRSSSIATARRPSRSVTSATACSILERYFDDDAGFLFAWRVKPWAGIVAVIAMEVGCAIWVRDNLTLNVIMLIHPFESDARRFGDYRINACDLINPKMRRRIKHA